MKNITIKSTGKILGVASDKLLSNNIEAYQNTIPSMLSNRLRNPKFSGPEDPQTGLAPEWEPGLRCMGVYSCKLVPGMYMSGREAQLIHNFGAQHDAKITQHGVNVREGEEFEVEMWARAHNKPVKVTVGLTLAGQVPTEGASAEMLVDQAHWVKRTCRIKAPEGGGSAFFTIGVSNESRLIIDQIHMKPIGEPHVAPAFLDSFDQFPCTVLRFPGGCESCTYHWEHSIGPVHLRPVCDDPVFKYKTHYDFGTDEYLELCVSKGIIPFITLNTTTDTPESAAEWVAYVRDYYVSRNLEVPAAYFMFGNENDGFHEIGHMTGEMYLSQLREFVPSVRKAYPEARILVIGKDESQGLRKEYETPWKSLLIEKGTDLFDVLVITSYSMARDRTLDISLERVSENIETKEKELQKQADIIRDAGLDCTMGIVEWNYWTRAGHNDHAEFYEPNDIRHCLYAAGHLNAFCRMGEILEIANYYALVNAMGMIRVKDGQVELTDIVKVFNLYAPALPGEVLELDFDTPSFEDGNRKVDINFIRKGDETYGFLINLSHDESIGVTLEHLGNITESRGITASDILTPVNEIKPEIDGDKFVLPPASLVRVICK